MASARIAGVFIAIFFLISPASAAPADVLKTLRPQHPRLFLLPADWAQVRQAIQNDPLAKQWYEKLLADSQKMLSEKPVAHVLIGPRLLDQSRAALRRISTLAAMYRLSGDSRFADRARTEMLTAAGFKDWNPSHFLDVAEMTNALAIGYDWLFDVLSPSDRQTIRQAIVEKGLNASLDIYAKHRWWAAAVHNWNQVCNGGMTVGALAIADEQPELAAKIISCGRDSIPLAMHSFAPDGGWAEGPGYWSYATSYNVFYLAALQTALQTDFDLLKTPGFRETGFFRIHSVGPIGKTFNYADAGEHAGTAPQMFWLARTFRIPAYAAHERQMVGQNPGIFDLLFYTPADATDAIAALPLDAAFRGVDVAFFRTAWNDPNALFVGFKGGNNRANHSHLDLGSFVLDAGGVRWAADLGSDEYNLPGYFGKQRYTYYRLRTESHNTLTFDGLNQSQDAHAPLVAFSSGQDRSFAVVDLTAAYQPKAQSVLRGIALLERKRVLIQDEIQTDKPVQVVWNFLTAAKIQNRGSDATLTQGQAQLHLHICEPIGATFQVISANPPPPQRQQPGMHNLSIVLSIKAKESRIVVLLSPGDGDGPAPKIEPLQAWIAASKANP
jgi:hypothetical protein